MEPMPCDDSFVITDAQWAAAKQAFYEMIEESKLGRAMSSERYELIMCILKSWDNITPAERREMSSNAYFWHSKFKVASAGDADDGQLLAIDTMKPVVTHENLFETIKNVHIDSTLCCHRPRTAMCV